MMPTLRNFIERDMIPHLMLLHTASVKMRRMGKERECDMDEIKQSNDRNQ